MQQNEEINFICSSGGMKAMFISGCLAHFNNMNYIVKTSSGASSGAFAAACVLCKVDTNRCLNIYKELQQNNNNMYVGEVMREFCERILPSDAHILCNKKLFVSIYILTIFGIKRKIINEFHSREDLIDCLLASSTVPYITFPKLYYKFRDWKCIDGIYPELIESDKLFFCNLWGIKYCTKLSGSIKDENIEQFVSNGRKHFINWLSGCKKQSGIFHIGKYFMNMKLRLIVYLLHLIGYMPITIGIYLLIKLIFYFKSFLYNLN